MTPPTNGKRVRACGWMIAASIACFAVGTVFSHRTEPGVRVERVNLDGNTPALQFLPAGPGPHPVALLAHGVTASKETLFRFGEALAAAGFVCFAVDLPGHGETRHSYSPQENVQTLVAAARQIGPVDVFIGHSMGAGAGAAAVRTASLEPRLFIAVGANPDLGEHGPPLLLLAGRFDELLSLSELKARADARLVVSPWSDHALEPYDPKLVNAGVEAACVAAGKTPPAAPTCWRWRLIGLFLSVAGALGLGLCLPEVFPPLARVRGLLIPIIVIVAFALSAGTWLGATPHLPHAPMLIGATAVTLLVVMGSGRLGVPRWSFAASAAAVCVACVIVGASALAFFMSLFALILFAGTVLGWIVARHGSRRDGDIAMSILVGYAIGQWIPRIF